jgi:probable phosphoglycerate mutase
MGALQIRSFYPLINIYIARHGETTWNVEGRIQGRSDPGLSPKGQQQSLALLDHLKNRSLSAIYSSTLQRSILTAQPIANHFDLPIRKESELDEIAFGILEGRNLYQFDEVTQSEWRRFKDDRFSYRIPGAENYTDVANRIKPFIEKTLRDHEGQEVLIVGHRVVNRLLIGMFLEFPLEWVLKIEQTHDCLYLIQRSDEAKVFHYIDGKVREGILLVGEEVIL